MKKIRIILLILLIICLPVIPVCAQDNYVYDTVSYFSSDTREALENLVNSFHERYNLNISIVSVSKPNTNGEFDLAEYANQFYQEHYGNSNGVIFAFNQFGGYYINVYGNAGQYFDMTQDFDALFKSGSQTKKAYRIQRLLHQMRLKIDGQDSLKNVVDMANLLTNEEVNSLVEKIDNTVKTYNLDAAVVTTYVNDAYTIERFADDYYDDNDYGIGDNKDGLLLVLNMSSREWHISTCGKAIDIFTDQNIEYLGDAMLSDLKDGNYFNGFNTFIDHVSEFAENYKPVDTAPSSNNEADSVTKEVEAKNDKKNRDLDKESGSNLLASLFLGFLVAYGMGRFKLRKLKTKRKVYNANNYIKEDSFVLTRSNDLFLFSDIKEKRKSKSKSEHHHHHHHHHESKPKPPEKTNESTTHYSSSGRRHGGGGGKF